MGTNYYLYKSDEKLKNAVERLASDINSRIGEFNRAWEVEMSSHQQLKPVEVPEETHTLTIHIGKNSMGWRFAFYGLHHRGLDHFLSRNYEDQGFKIRDEYGRDISFQEFKAIVEKTLRAPTGHEIRSDSSYYNEEGYRVYDFEFS